MADLPGAIVIGAQRCGTTRFYNLLKQHPGIAPAARKEVHFYDLRFGRGVKWYRSMFPDLTDRVGVEASPYYIYHPLCAERIYKTQPDVKIVAMLRNPVDRAYSNYHHEVRRGKEALSFEQAILSEDTRTQGEEKKIIDHGIFSIKHNQFSYLQRGHYMQQLQRYYDLFDRDQIMLIRSEDFYTDEQGVLQQVHEFVGVEPQIIDTDAFKGKKEYPVMLEETRHHLVEYFKPYNEELEDFTGRDFGWNR